MFEIKFSTDNAAFMDDPAEEVASILRGIATDIENGAKDGIAMDINGNKVGEWSLK